MELSIAIIFVVLGILEGLVLGAGFVWFKMKSKEVPPIQVNIPEIKFPDIKVSFEGQEMPGIRDINKSTRIATAEEYEKGIEKSRGIKKAEKMTEEYIDLNGMAQQLMDNYIDGKIDAN